MKNTLTIFAMMALILGAGVGFIQTQEAEAAISMKTPIAATVLEKKRCEKCKRGPDGKMVCEEVPCPK